MKCNKAAEVEEASHLLFKYINALHVLGLVICTSENNFNALSLYTFKREVKSSFCHLCTKSCDTDVKCSLVTLTFP